MNTWKVILATIVIFGTGVVTGGLLVRQVGQAHPVRVRPGLALERERHPTPPSAGGLRIEFLRRAQRELDLTVEQREKVDKLLKESQERTRKIMEPVTPQLRREVEETRVQFLRALTEDQRARFDEMMKQQQRARDAQRKSAPSKDRSTNNPA